MPTTVDLIVDGENRRYWGADFSLTLGPWYNINAEKNPKHEQRSIEGSLTHSIVMHKLKMLPHALKIKIEEHKDYENGQWYHRCNLVSLEGSTFGVVYVNDGTGKPLSLRAGKTLTIRGSAGQLKL